MSIEDVRPVLSGLAGALFAIALSCTLARWIPTTFRGKSAEALADDHRVAIRLANVTFVLSALAVLTVHQWLGVSRSDWRPLSIGFGFALLSPLVMLPLGALISRRSPREALVAFAIGQKLPPTVIYLLCGMGLPLIIAGLVALRD